MSRLRSSGLLPCGLVVSLSLAVAIAGFPAHAQEAEEILPPKDLPHQPDSPGSPSTRSGWDIYENFRSGLADPECDVEATGGRWKRQFAHAPGQLSRTDDDLLPLFGYVVDVLREAQLPTEFALIPFVESGYRPGARNRTGPSGLWQFIGTTARNHGVSIRNDYDGRLSPADSTQAAVRYLKTLHGMFGGDWRLTVMAYNAGEFRILQAMRRAGVNASNAQPARLTGLSPITYAYVEKLHALACIFQQADDADDWRERLQRQVPHLVVQELPSDAHSLEHWARANGHDSAQIKRLNPALSGKLPKLDRSPQVLAPASANPPLSTMDEGPVLASNAEPTESKQAAPQTAPAQDTRTAALPRAHKVRSGESVWTIARRYGLKPQQLLARNGLKPDAILRPGMTLKLE